jgi:hypothetical protein
MTGLEQLLRLARLSLPTPATCATALLQIKTGQLHFLVCGFICYEDSHPLLTLTSFLTQSLSLILLSVWNGAGYYVEVWGRRFERELDALKREIEATQRASAAEESAPGTRPASQRGSDVEGELEKDK